MQYAPPDPEAHPFKEKSHTKPRLQWQKPTYITLDENQANEKRATAIINQEIVDSIERLSKIIGPDIAGKYFGKFFENLKFEELTKGHYEIKHP